MYIYIYINDVWCICYEMFRACGRTTQLLKTTLINLWSLCKFRLDIETLCSFVFTSNPSRCRSSPTLTSSGHAGRAGTAGGAKSMRVASVDMFQLATLNNFRTTIASYRYWIVRNWCIWYSCFLWPSLAVLSSTWWAPGVLLRATCVSDRISLEGLAIRHRLRDWIGTKTLPEISRCWDAHKYFS